MKKTLLAVVCLFVSAPTVLADDYTRYVNPFIGTQTDATGALSGSTFPGPTMPQGMVQLSPETENYVTWDPCSGYDYNKDKIYGFTHTHLSGTGCEDMGDILIMPVTGELPEGARLARVANMSRDSSLNLRSQPSAGAEILRRLYWHQELIVLEQSDVPGWVHVKTDAVEGYVMESFLSYPEEDEDDAVG